MQTEYDDVKNVIEWLRHSLPTLIAASFSVFIALLRIAYEDLKTGKTTRTRQKVIEALLCGGITVAVVSGASMLHLPAEASSFVAGCVGFLGVDKVREFAEKWIGKRVQPLDRKDDNSN